MEATRKPPSTWDPWLLAFSRVFDRLPLAAHEPCPHCGRDALRVVIVAELGESSGHAHFWCDHCHYGVWLSRVVVPDGVALFSPDATREEFAERVTRYRMVGGE